MQRFSSLRSRLSLPVPVAVAPAFALIGYSAYEQRRDALAEAQGDAIRLAAAAARPYFRRALDTRNFAVGDYQVGRITRRPSVNLAFPLLDPSGDLQAVLFLAVDLSWFNRLVFDSGLPRGSTLKLLDSGGMLLARYPHRSDRIGTPTAAREVLAAA